jgi:anaerobic selenocysteine-containing dehydrogenase
MGKVGNLESIVERYGPHLHDAPYGGWRADRVIDKIVPTHCPYCAVQCGMNLLVENNHVVGCYGLPASPPSGSPALPPHQTQWQFRTRHMG